MDIWELFNIPLLALLYVVLYFAFVLCHARLVFYPYSMPLLK